jgi:hypothetical protein
MARFPLPRDGAALTGKGGPERGPCRFQHGEHPFLERLAECLLADQGRFGISFLRVSNHDSP